MTTISAIAIVLCVIVAAFIVVFLVCCTLVIAALVLDFAVHCVEQGWRHTKNAVLDVWEWSKWP